MRLFKQPSDEDNRSKPPGRRRQRIALLQHTAVQAALVLAMGGALAFLLTIRPATGPAMPPDLPVGEPAPHEIRATHNFSVVRVDTTELERRRQEAENQVLPVWDFDVGRNDTVAEHIGQTFDLMRRYLKQVAEERRIEQQAAEQAQPPGLGGAAEGSASVLPSQPASPASEGSGLLLPTDPGSSPQPPPSQLAEPTPGLDAEGSGHQISTTRPSQDELDLESPAVPARDLGLAANPQQDNGDLALLAPQERVQIIMDHRDELIAGLQAGLNLTTITALAKDGFSLPTENALKQLVSEILSHPLVHSREVLLAQTGTGIELRTQRLGRTLQETTRRTFHEFIDQNEVPDRLQELASTLLPASLEDETREAILATAIELVSVNINTRFNPGETDARRLTARAQVQPQADITHYRRGDVLLLASSTVGVADREAIDIMRALGRRDPEVRANEVMIGILIYVLLVLVGVMTYAFRFIRHFHPNWKDLTCLTVILLFMVGLTKLLMMLAGFIGEKFPEFPVVAIYTGIPFAAGAILIRLVMNAESSLIFAIVYSLLVALMLPHQPIFAAYAFLGSLVGMGVVERAPTRMTFFKAGFFVGLINLAFGFAMVLLSSSLVTRTAIWILLSCLLSGLSVAILVTALLPLLESSFHYITDIKLLELSNPNHPALHDLLVRAPGSYHHSMIVGNLVEAACTAVGANPLLGRVGAYYHDIGKAKNPQYFAENQSRTNPHDKLKPSMSALIIKSHVKDGMDIATTYRLPKQIAQFIEEHQGTSLISFFYQKAKEQEDSEREEIQEKDFRYPGPRPQTTETAICMLADRIEAAARALTDPTPARLKGLVQRIINGAFTDGQLDECDLTLKDLDNIAREMIRILVSVYHQRPEYPKEKHPTTAKVPAVTAKEAPDGGGDRDTADSGEPGPEEVLDSSSSAATLKRLGIVQGRAVDPANRRPRD
ncbi:MAG: HDIG domain-containing protein [Bradymonadales bacterium]|nr:HDIG domain-containing protein [Bradymonadales bacterium]